MVENSWIIDDNLNVRGLHNHSLSQFWNYSIPDKYEQVCGIIKHWQNIDKSNFVWPVIKIWWRSWQGLHETFLQSWNEMFDKDQRLLSLNPNSVINKTKERLSVSLGFVCVISILSPVFQCTIAHFLLIVWPHWNNSKSSWKPLTLSVEEKLHRNTFAAQKNVQQPWDRQQDHKRIQNQEGSRPGGWLIDWQKGLKMPRGNQKIEKIKGSWEECWIGDLGNQFKRKENQNSASTGNKSLVRKCQPYMMCFTALIYYSNAKERKMPNLQRSLLPVPVFKQTFKCFCRCSLG